MEPGDTRVVVVGLDVPFVSREVVVDVVVVAVFGLAEANVEETVDFLTVVVVVVEDTEPTVFGRGAAETVLVVVFVTVLQK